jgi:hypothetical protein
MIDVPRGLRRLVTTAILCVTVVLATAAEAPRSGTLRWHADRNEIDADIDGWPLSTLLEEIATSTGWQIYVEPDTNHTVATRFEKLGTADALRRLLDGLSFALLPQVAGPPKLFVYQGSVDRATQQVRGRTRGGAGKREPIADERIVILKHGAGGIDALASRLGAKVVGRVDGIGAYRLRFDDAGSAADADGKLKGESDVDTVESNFTIVPPGTIQPLAAGGAAAPRLVPDITPSTDKVIVGLIDMPVQDVGGRLNGFLAPGISVVGDYQPSSGPLSHGTAMAETIVDGVARALAERGDTSGKVGLSILPIDVYGSNPETNTFSVAQGLYEALDRHVNVVNLSLGGDSDSRLLRDLTQAAAKHGVVVVGAAGNEPVATPLFPAADPGVISVTASDASGGLAPYANTGRWVDAMAPGENVLSYADQAWYGTGTSFATSWVSGWAAGYIASPGSTRTAAIRETMERWARPRKP